MENKYPGIEVYGTRGFGQGRSLRSAKDFQPGELIAVFAEPLVTFPDAAKVKTTCSHCLSQDVRVVGCTGCEKAVKYCSSDCQKADWKLVHSKECKVFRKVKGAVGKDWLPTPVRALVQLLVRWPEVQQVVNKLEGNVERFQQRTELWEGLKLQAYAGIHYANRKEDDANLHMATEILCKIQTNSFDRFDPDTGQSGTFLDPVLAMVNHSCVPNAAVVFSGRKAVLRAENPIRKGGFITISYIDYTKPLRSRRQDLDLYHFQCQCRRCSDDLDVYQVCQSSPMTALNANTLSPGPETLLNPHVDLDLCKRESWRSRVEEIYSSCVAERTRDPDPPVAEERLGDLKASWLTCRPLIDAKTWALQPLAQTIRSATLYYLAVGDLTRALSTACFTAICCDPYQYAAPFKTFRLTGLLLIAKIMTQASVPGSEELAGSAEPRVLAVMEAADKASMLHALLLLVVSLAPKAHAEDWHVAEEARAMLSGIESVSGREQDASLLRDWVSNPEGSSAGKAFFHEKVMQPVEELAKLAVNILHKDLRA